MQSKMMSRKSESLVARGRSAQGEKSMSLGILVVIFEQLGNGKRLARV